MIQIYFWNYLFRKLINEHASNQVLPNGDLTILICAKNEASRLKTLIPTLFQQSIPCNILVVDDFSDDDTLSLLSAYANNFPSFKYISASKNTRGKKQALMDGLAEVNTNWVLLTDADCLPTTNQWAELMLNAAQSKELVLGYSPYRKTSGFLNRWIRYEAVLTAIQYFSFSLIGKTYMGVGRNLLYAKAAVNSGEKLLKNIDLNSGDDDLLVNAIATEKNVAIQLDPDSWTISEPKQDWKSYFNQKRRHMTTASRYKTSHQLMLLIFSSSWILFYLCIINLLFSGKLLYVAILLLIRLISTYSTNYKLFPKLGLKDSLTHWWYLDPSTAVYFLFFSIFVLLPQKESW